MCTIHTSSLLHVDFLCARVFNLATDVPDPFAEHVELCREGRHIVLAHLATPFSSGLGLVIHVKEHPHRRATCVKNNILQMKSFSVVPRIAGGLSYRRAARSTSGRLPAFPLCVPVPLTLRLCLFFRQRWCFHQDQLPRNTQSDKN